MWAVYKTPMDNDLTFLKEEQDAKDFVTYLQKQEDCPQAGYEKVNPWDNVKICPLQLSEKHPLKRLTLGRAKSTNRGLSNKIDIIMSIVSSAARAKLVGTLSFLVDNLNEELIEGLCNHIKYNGHHCILHQPSPLYKTPKQLAVWLKKPE